MSGGPFLEEKAPRQLTSLLGKIGGVGGIPKEAAHPVGAAALELVTQGFETETDPYGRKWKRTVGRAGQVLSDTGRLKNSWRVSVTDKSVRLVNATRYAAIHQYGGVIKPVKAKALRFKLGDAWVVKRKVTIPQRQMVPTDGPSAKWEKAFAEEVKAVLEDLEAFR